MRENPKFEGEIGQAITIGELAKYRVQCALPLSDNLPFDIIVIYNGGLYKSQIKTSAYTNNGIVGSIAFDLTTSNWHQKKTIKYDEDEIDCMVLCDYRTIYLLGKSDFKGRSSFSIRTTPAKNGQTKNCNMADDYVISQERLEKVFVSQ